MEDQVRAAAVSDPANRGWIISPVVDLLFLANLGWLVLLVPGFASSRGTHIDFWQIYFLTLPHRWLTLVLVATDRDRRAGLESRLAVIAVIAAACVAGAYFGTGMFLCLAMIDYVWNAWHFASQHAGVLRIYSRKVGGGNEWLERWGLRIFVTYAALRAAGWTTGALEGSQVGKSLLSVADYAVLIVPLALLAVNLRDYSRERIGKLVYLASVCSLYTGFVLSLSFGFAVAIVTFAAAGSLFHAVEYITIVSHYAHRRTAVGSRGVFRQLAGSWLAFLAVYLLALGTVGVWASRADSGIAVFWQGLNLWAAFVHYAYDGLIWKLRKPETAVALGVRES